MVPVSGDDAAEGVCVCAEGEWVDGGVRGEAHLAAHVARHRLLVRRDRQPRLGQQHHVGDVLSPATFQNGYSAHVTSTKGWEGNTTKYTVQ